MRSTLFVSVLVVTAVALIVGISTVGQVSREQIALSSRLESRTEVLAESFADAVTPAYRSYATSSVQSFVQKMAADQRVAGIGVFDSSGTAVAMSSDLPEGLALAPLITQAMDSNDSVRVFESINGIDLFIFVEPLHGSDENAVIGALAVVQNSTYIKEAIGAIWRDNLLRLLLQAFVFICGVLVLVRWTLVKPLLELAASVKAARRGETARIEGARHHFLQPLSDEIAKLSDSLHSARKAASQEARFRLEQIDTPWTEGRLQEFMKAYFKNRQIFVMSNREPYVHLRGKRGVEVSVPAHGMITALDALMQACGGTWIAHGGGDADQSVVDANDRIAVPPDEPRYTLKRVWLSKEEVHGYYVGFSNEALFPLCLMTHTRPVFRPEDWATYRAVNVKFADALLSEIRHVKQPLVLIQDLHFALVPRIIKKSRPDAQIAIFWHHPWPSAEQFSICPWRKEILDGMLGADLVGFHIQQYCNNFIETVGKELEARIDVEQFAVISGGHASLVRAFPISIPFTGAAAPIAPAANPFAQFGVSSELVVLGVDRLDYTKGIIERLQGLELFLDTYPEYRKRLTFVQIAAPSREAVRKYREYGAEVEREVARINGKLQTASWKPIVFVKRQLSHQELRPLYQAAQVCLVTSLHDGMNLVAKEYVAERDRSGVLILSAFAGASRELSSALIINPYSPEDIANAIYQGLTMPPSEQYRRMKALQSVVSNYNVYRWAMEMIKTLAQTRVS